jgi:trans-aconitate 2-methyltransferase
MPRDWDAATYDRIADPQLRWGTAVLDRLTLEGPGTILDAGCGSGRVTELIAERFPNARIVALDGSPSMLDQARGRLERFGDRIAFLEADLLRSLPVDEPVDAVFSTATFHWVPDHDALFANLAGAMRPGARLIAQCGGSGNLTSVVKVLRDLEADTFTGKVFATPEETEQRLRNAGFNDIDCWLHTEPTAFGSLDELETFLRTVVLGDHVHTMSDEEGAAFTHAVASRLPGLELDYVRLNIGATRGQERPSR